MATEIERKFLVTGDAWRQPDAQRLTQGYLNRDKQRTVRVRLAGTRAWLTVKGLSAGATRAEYEYEIPAADAAQLLALCEGPVIDKFRHVVAHAGLTWEVDEFLGDNLGLVVAEVELAREDQAIVKPAWLGDEVTHDARYLNSSLSSHPFRDW